MGLHGLSVCLQVRCAGNESALEQCRHEDFGVTNCKHDEDVGVECLGGDEQAATRALEEQAVSDRHVDINKYLPDDCGTRLPLENEFTPTVQLAKVVLGRGTPPGAYPWQVRSKDHRVGTQRLTAETNRTCLWKRTQASIRVRSGLKSVHWCGAVLVGPQHVLTAAHCMADYTKKAYFVRVGDHNSEVRVRVAERCFAGLQSPLQGRRQPETCVPGGCLLSG